MSLHYSGPMDPQVALQAVLTGLAQGAVYGLVALGFTLVHRLVRVLSSPTATSSSPRSSSACLSPWDARRW